MGVGDGHHGYCDAHGMLAGVSRGHDHHTYALSSYLTVLCSKGPFSAAWMVFREQDQADSRFSYTTLQLLMSSAIKVCGM